jgi:hypothetical protein
MADYERLGAELEVRWAELADPNAGGSRQLTREIQRGAERASGILTQLAHTLEKSAELADVHADRREASGLSDAAADERQVAMRARQAAQRARSQAAHWLGSLGRRES